MCGLRRTLWKVLAAFASPIIIFNSSNAKLCCVTARMNVCLSNMHSVDVAFAMDLEFYANDDHWEFHARRKLRKTGLRLIATRRCNTGISCREVQKAIALQSCTAFVTWVVEQMYVAGKLLLHDKQNLLYPD